MARLPHPGGDNGNWGDILNDYLSQVHNADGTLKDDSVGASQLQNNAITSAQLAPGAVTKSDVGLGNVDNTSDADKPISDATQTELDAKANTADVVANTDLDTKAATLIATSSSSVTTALKTRYVTPRAALLYDPATKSNGQLAASLTADTGQTMTAFVHSTGQAPLKISSGVLTHTPTGVAGTSAGYLQADMGGRVRRIGAMVSWPLNALGVAALVIPSASWAPNTLPDAGFHLSVNGNGVWALIRFTLGGSTTLATYQTHGRFDNLTWGSGFKPLEVWLDPDNQKAVITWPDGTTSTVTSPYFASETGNYAIWELFENNGTDVAASFGKLWADTAPTTPDITGLTSYRLPGRNAPAAYNVSGVLTPNLAQASVHLATLAGNVTSLSFSNPQYAGQEIELHLIQDATGSRTLSGASATIKWASGAAPTLTTTANRRDIFRFRHVGGVYYEISRSINVG